MDAYVILKYRVLVPNVTVLVPSTPQNFLLSPGADAFFEFDITIDSVSIIRPQSTIDRSANFTS